MDDPTAALTFDDVTVPAGPRVGGLSRVTFALPAGGVAYVAVDPDQPMAPFVDLALGLLDPVGGRVRFRGRDWRDMDPFTQAAARGETGTVFETSLWVSSLTVCENILLRMQYHTGESDAQLLEQATRLAGALGLTGVRQERPDAVATRELRLWEWVRALVGRPAMVILAYPGRGAPSWAMAKLTALLQPALTAGTAVLWIGDAPMDIGIEAPGGARHYRLSGEKLAGEGEGNHE